VLALTAIISTYFTFKAIHPFRASPKAPQLYHSNLFFGHVAEHADPEAFKACLMKTDAEGRTYDLAAQAYILAKGLNGKFSNLDVAVMLITKWQMPTFGILLAIKIISSIIELAK